MLRSPATPVPPATASQGRGLTKRYPGAYATFVGSIVTMVLRSW